MSLLNLLNQNTKVKDEQTFPTKMSSPIKESCLDKQSDINAEPVQTQNRSCVAAGIAGNLNVDLTNIGANVGGLLFTLGSGSFGYLCGATLSCGLGMAVGGATGAVLGDKFGGLVGFGVGICGGYAISQCIINKLKKIPHDDLIESGNIGIGFAAQQTKAKEER